MRICEKKQLTDESEITSECQQNEADAGRP